MLKLEIKKVLAVLMSVLFVVSLTAAAVGARNFTVVTDMVSIMVTALALVAAEDLVAAVWAMVALAAAVWAIWRLGQFGWLWRRDWE